MKKGSDRQTVAWLFDVAKGKRRYIALLLFLQTVTAISLVCYALFLQGIVDNALAHNREGLIFYGLLLVGLVVFRMTTRAIYRVVDEHTKATLENALKQRLFSALLKRDFGAVTATHSGEWMTRLTSDAILVSTDVADLLPNLCGTVVRMSAALVAMVAMAPEFGILLVLGGGVLMVVTLLMRKKLKQLHLIMKKADGAVRVFLSERLGSLLTIRAFGQEDETLAQSGEHMDAHRATRMKRVHFSNWCNSGMFLVVNGAYVASAIYCGIGIYTGTMSYGTFTAVLQLVSQVQNPISSISGFVPRYYAMLASAERLMEAESFREDDLRKEVEDVHTFYREEFLGMELKNARFAYRAGRESPELLNGLDLTIRKGEYVAFTGPSGCGKSTVLKLLMCLYQLDSGERNIMSTDGTRPLTAGWRELFAYVPQGNQLMNGTIREVVTFGDRTAMTRDGDIHRALEIACADKFVDELPDGLDTQLGERGAGLSEGQMQRIAVARAVFSDRPVLLLDEATSALDDETERQLLRNLRAMTERTVIIITHRSAVLDVTDQEIRFHKPDQGE
jgi:ATP-binding cassette subfamily B protein